MLVEDIELEVQVIEGRFIPEQDRPLVFRRQEPAQLAHALADAPPYPQQIAEPPVAIGDRPRDHLHRAGQHGRGRESRKLPPALLALEEGSPEIQAGIEIVAELYPDRRPLKMDHASGE